MIVPCFMKKQCSRKRIASDAYGRAIERAEYEIIYMLMMEVKTERWRFSTGSTVGSLRSLIRPSRTLGHQVAVTAVSARQRRRRGVIDADLQVRRGDSADGWARWREGDDVAYGETRVRDGETSIRRSRRNTRLLSCDEASHRHAHSARRGDFGAGPARGRGPARDAGVDCFVRGS